MSQRGVRLVRVTDELPAGFDAMRAEARSEGHGMLDSMRGNGRPARRGSTAEARPYWPPIQTDAWPALAV